MDSERVTLDPIRLQAGRALLAQTDALDFGASGAAWVYLRDADWWEFRLITPLVDTKGRRWVYERLIEALTHQGLPDGIDWMHFGVMSPQESLYQGFPRDARPDAPIAVDDPDPYGGEISQAIVYRALPPTDAREDRSADFHAKVQALLAA